MTITGTDILKNDIANQVADPCTLVIFGANGDLTKRLLIPALCNLAGRKHLPKNFAVIGTGQVEMTDEEFRSQMSANIKTFAPENIDPILLQWFIERMYFVKTASKDSNGCEKLKLRLSEVDKKHQTAGNYLFYMAVPPDAVTQIVEHLAEVELTKQTKDFWRRLIIEKPFGHDLNSARALNNVLLKVAQENQIFRIDHYLGKESVQNIMVFRFANGIFEPIWNNKYIDNIQITVAESLGVEGRGTYYDNTGALRDMIQNHLFQMLALTTMEAPKYYDSGSVRDRKREIFNAIRPYEKTDILANIVRGQYDKGVIADKPVCPYRDEPSVRKDSMTETFVALKVLVDNDRWSGVPIYLRTGKRLSKRLTEIAIQFKDDRLTDFGDTSIKHLTPNSLVLKIQPDEGICLQFGAKVPGEILSMQMLEMHCEYSDYFGKQITNGYETLLYDCLIGDCTLFARADNVETNWGIVDPILKYWQNATQDKLENYPSGTSGPISADKLLKRDGREWRKI